jgi:cytoskeletal protein RodZ
MNNKNKQILIYAGGALVLGAVTFFVWSFFQKPVVPVGDTTISLNDKGEVVDTSSSNDQSNNQSNPIKSQFTDLANTQFSQIQTPNIAGDLENLIKGK